MTMLNSKCRNQKRHPCLYNAEQFSMPEVLHNICNMRSCDLPDMSALALGHCAPSYLCVHIRQITPALVTYITYTILCTCFMCFIEATVHSMKYF